MKNEYDKQMPCPCQSGKSYGMCCMAFHQGKKPDTALELMRSRYAAYALSLADYIIHTTHPASPQFCSDPIEWARQISEFSSQTEFKELEILGFQERGSFATVTFVAHLLQNKKDVSFTERSYFEKVQGKWLYLRGQLAPGREPRLVSTGPLRLLALAYYGDPILRKVADPIQKITDDIHKLVEDMIETMDASDGIGLAAPQVHRSIQLFIIRKPVEMEGGKVEFGEVKVFINPKVSNPSIETWKVSEGCLSIPTINGEVERPKEITVEYLDLEGRLIQERVSGWEARVIMHENDHINGILFIDHLEAEIRKGLEPLLQGLSNRVSSFSLCKRVSKS
jgi:peptide deformylase